MGHIIYMTVIALSIFSAIALLVVFWIICGFFFTRCKPGEPNIGQQISAFFGEIVRALSVLTRRRK